jgi:ribose 5-phosphate isomerase B
MLKNNMALKIAIGGDHAGYAYKQDLIDQLKKQGYDVTDFGPETDASVDYPDHVHPLAKAINAKELDFGVLICGSGNGVAMTANKYPNVRAALCWQTDLARLAREHNNANIICIPSRFVSKEVAEEMMHTFLTTAFEGGRHQRRVEKISSC